VLRRIVVVKYFRGKLAGSVMFKSASTIVASTLLALLVAAPLAFGAQRTFVSAQTGNDTNPCTVAAPCRGFAAALANTDAGGEIVVLDSGGYGPVTITKAVAIQAPAGIHAAISVFSGNGIAVTAGAADSVTLKGLSITGQGGTSGIAFSSGASLFVIDCAVSGFAYAGLVFNAASPTSVGVVDRSVFTNNQYGISNGAGILTVRNSIASKNSGAGMLIFGLAATGGATLDVFDSLLDSNGTGLHALTNNGGPSHVRLSGNRIVNNTTGINLSGSSDAVSIGNNMIRGNGTDKIGAGIAVVAGD
jgi:nitrous oxidase accessory protein NosD